MVTTTNDDGFREIQLSGKQLVFLFMAVTVVSVVIFLCGVLVGRGVRAERAQAETTATAPESALPPPARPQTNNAKPGDPSMVAPAMMTDTKLSTPPISKVDPPPVEAEPEPDAKAGGTPAAMSEARSATPAPAQPAAPAAAAAPAVDVPTEPGGSGYAVQVAAVKDRTEAEAVIARLTNKGYKAFLVPPSKGAPALYRVRVGKFADRKEADGVAEKLKKEERFNVWVLK
jgi:rare lipoprotein A